MLTTVNHLIDEFSTIRTGRANPALVDKLSVEYYGTKTPLQQLATISVPDPKLLVIQPFDKSSLEEIEKSMKWDIVANNKELQKVVLHFKKVVVGSAGTLNNNKKTTGKVKILQ